MSASTHSPVLKHHFADLGQQHASERLGMWMFLVTEILFFGGLFAGYTVYRIWYPDDFIAASSHLNRTIATVNTLFLITSSLTMTLAIRAAKLGDRKGLYAYLLITAGLATAFMVMKGFEYAQDFEERLVPGTIFQEEHRAAYERVFPPDQKPLTREEAEAYFKANPQNHQRWAVQLVLNNYGKSDSEHGYISPARMQLFLCFYYVMTAIHGIHILIGIGCILWLVFENWRGTIPPENYSTVEVVSLYWHLVDVIWLFLMPLLYLAGAGVGHH